LNDESQQSALGWRFCHGWGGGGGILLYWWHITQETLDMHQFVIQEFRPLRLTLDHLGPFQLRVEEIDFTNEANEPCNLFLLLSQNGRGKTTVLEVMAKLMGMLGYLDSAAMAKYEGRAESSPFDFDGLDSGRGRAQLDVLLRFAESGNEQVVVLSLIAGMGEAPLHSWQKEDCERVGASEWDGFSFFHNQSGRWTTNIPRAQWVFDLHSIVAKTRRSDVGELQGDLPTLPTLIYFPAYRNVTQVAPDQQRTITSPRDWNYRPSYTFGTTGGDWRDSLDNLLVWLKWLDNGRFEEVVKLVNDRVFDGTTTSIKGIRRDPPEAEVVRDGSRHRLDALSSGEKSLVQLFMRIGAHRTRNTILLIDEPEVHLHENWKYRLFYQLKKLAQDAFPGLTIIVATHSQEMMTALALELDEPNLIKGGYLFETATEEAKADQIRQEALVTYGNA
jgi:predicted ATPase